MGERNPVQGTAEEGLVVALRLLRASGKSRSQLRDQLLQRGLSHSVCDEVLVRLEHLGYLDDEKLAAARARTLLESGGYGRAGVERKLQALGVDPSVTTRVVTEAAGELGMEERAMARALIQKRWKGRWPRTSADCAKAARLLAARGFADFHIEALLGDGALDLQDRED